MPNSELQPKQASINPSKLVLENIQWKRMRNVPRVRAVVRLGNGGFINPFRCSRTTAACFRIVEWVYHKEFCGKWTGIAIAHSPGSHSSRPMMHGLLMGFRFTSNRAGPFEASPSLYGFQTLNISRVYRHSEPLTKGAWKAEEFSQYTGLSYLGL